MPYLRRPRAALWLLREGLSLARAYRAARIEHPGRGRFMFASEIRCAAKRLRARPGSSLACAGLLAVGIGVCTSAFSAIDAVLVNPAPFRDPDRLLQQSLWYAEPALMDGWRGTGKFEAVEAVAAAPFRMRFDGDAVTLAGAALTAGTFDMLGVRPVAGRVFGARRGQAGPPDEVILSETIWKNVFGGDPAIVGSRIALDDGTAVVAGIMPAGFRFPTPDAVVWKPLYPRSRERGLFTIVGRLKEGVLHADAEAQIKVLARELARLPRSYAGSPPVRRVDDPPIGDVTAKALWLLLGGAALVFIALCANVSGLVLTSLSARRREFGMCTALGASRSRLMREAVLEQSLVAAAGAGAGIWLAWGLTRLVPQVFQGHTLNPIDIDTRALALAAVLGVAAVIVSGLIPAWLGTRSDALEALRGSRRGGGSRVAANGFLVVEVALACALLAGSAILVRSFANMIDVPRGLNSDGILRIGVEELDDVFGSNEGMALAASAIADRFAAWPAVSAVALSRELPPGPTLRANVHLTPGAPSDSETSIRSETYRVDPSFFSLYGIPILRGRSFQSTDAASDVIVSERLASLLWPGQDPLDRMFAIGRSASRVIGVAGEIRLPALDASIDLPELYRPLGRESRTLFVNMRCRAVCPGDDEIRAQIHAVHPGLRARIRTPAEDVFRQHQRLPRAAAEVGGLFAVVGLIASAGGLFSVLIYAVSRRRSEFGVRSALGASPAQIRGLVFRDAMTVVGIGMIAGAGAGWIVARSLAAFHYGVTELDAVAWAAVLVTIVLTSCLAAWYPARQAARTDPLRLLRAE
ncbi:MAG: FtsX-like permease family protein [Vicinamibacterales bacterium]